MAEYEAILQALPFHDLRSIATYLRLEPAATVTKKQLLATIIAYWHHAESQRQGVQRLSPAAQRALWWLCHTAAVPAEPFWAEFGDVRRARDRQPGQPAPWQQPATAAEELFYSGLLHPHGVATAGALDRARQLLLPTPLRHQLAGLVAAPQAAPQVDDDLPFLPEAAGVTPYPLVQDLGQYLIYLHQIHVQQPDPLRLLHNRWLPPRHLRAVAARLIFAQARQALRSHKGNPWLCLLAFLATAAELHDAGRLTVHGWAWLAEPPPIQVALLWRGWHGSDWEVRDAYAQADALLPLPWPSLLTAALASVQAPFTATDLAAQLLSRESISVVYWNLYLETLQDLLDRLAALCLALLTPLGIITPTEPATRARPGLTDYTLTPLGRALVQNESATVAPSTLPSTGPFTGAHLPVTLTTAETHACITIAFPCRSPASLSPASLSPASLSPNPLHAQAVIAGYADYLDRDVAAHRYQISAATLARAAAAKLGLAPLAAALQAVAIPLTPPLWRALRAGYGQGQQLQFQPATLLRTTTADQLAALHGQRPLAALFAEILTPTTALLGVDPIAAQATLQQHGYSVQSLPAPATPPAAQPDTATTSVALQQGDRELLWLAGQLYTLLAEHLPLPVPPAAEPLQALYTTLSSTTQATLAAQRQIMAEQLGALLDNLPFTPPLEPSDPAAWIPLIDAALAKQQLLQMSYFTAGRNLTTHRLVEPYWRETHRGVDYLRAYCHSAGHVLTFRLDRIETLEKVNRDV